MPCQEPCQLLCSPLTLNMTGAPINTSEPQGRRPTQHNTNLAPEGLRSKRPDKVPHYWQYRPSVQPTVGCKSSKHHTSRRFIFESQPFQQTALRPNSFGWMTMGQASPPVATLPNLTLNHPQSGSGDVPSSALRTQPSTECSQGQLPMVAGVFQRHMILD